MFLLGEGYESYVWHREKCFVVMFCESSVKNLVLPAKLFFTWFDIEAIKKQGIPTEVSLYPELSSSRKDAMLEVVQDWLLQKWDAKFYSLRGSSHSITNILEVLRTSVCISFDCYSWHKDPYSAESHSCGLTFQNFPAILGRSYSRECDILWNENQKTVPFLIYRKQVIWIRVPCKNLLSLKRRSEIGLYLISRYIAELLLSQDSLYLIECWNQPQALWQWKTKSHPPYSNFQNIPQWYSLRLERWLNG